MTETFTRFSPTEWRWSDGDRQRSARLFNSTRRIIWSAWVDTSGGPVFDDGMSQTYDAFLASGPPAGISVPDVLLAELREAAEGGSDRGRKPRFCNG